MIEIIKSGTKIDFVSKRYLFVTASALLLAVCVFFIVNKGFNLGIDFIGGTVLQVRFTDTVKVDDIRDGLRPAIDGDFVIQSLEKPNEVLVRIGGHGGVNLQSIESGVRTQLEASFAEYSPKIERAEQIGPQVGKDLRRKAFLAVLYSVIGILIYVAFRFEFMFAIGAIISLVHDIAAVLGVYCIIGKEFNLTVMAAVLTVAGYSLNDTIVIFDRIREKVKTGKLGECTWKEIINMSINETLSRTVLTSVLTFIAVFSLYIFGGEVINGFALVMMLGIIVGTYSSIGIAAIFIYFIRSRQDVMVKNLAPRRAGGMR